MNGRMETLLCCSRYALIWAWLLVPIVAVPQIRIEVGTAPTAQSAALKDQVQLALLPHPEFADIDVHITIGAVALQEELRRDEDHPIIAAYLTSTDFQAIIGAEKRPRRVTAVFANPDPRDQLTLARVLLGEHAVVGVFDSSAADSLLRPPVSNTLRSLKARSAGDINSILHQADSLDALLVLPDGVLTRDNIHHAVRTLYGRRVVLIGHSEILTRVGSLASVYVPATSIAVTVRDILTHYVATRELPPPAFVADVDVAVNARLARSLNLIVPPPSALVHAVRAGRQPP